MLHTSPESSPAAPASSDSSDTNGSSRLAGGVVTDPGLEPAPSNTCRADDVLACGSRSLGISSELSLNLSLDSRRDLGVV